MSQPKRRLGRGRGILAFLKYFFFQLYTTKLNYCSSTDFSAGNCTLGENKFNPSARLDAPHSEALFFNYRSVLLCPGEGGDV